MENKKVLIVAEDLITTIRDDPNIDGEHFARMKQHIKDAPAADAVEVVHGRWKDVKETSLYVPDMKYTVTHTAETCSVCNVRIGFIGSKLYLYDNICPNCGAKMDGERKDNDKPTKEV